jgi:hypothetical protein
MSMSLNNAEDHIILNELYVHACRALLSAYGLTANVQEHGSGAGARNKANYVSLLGASGEGIRLSSILKIDRNLVISLHPLGSANVSQPDLEDWCLELNNQLVGRLKNKLLGYGRVVNVGLPVLLTGTDVSAVTAANSEVRQYSVESADGQITLTLATLIAPDVELHEMEPSMNGDEVLVEGEVALF